MADDDYGIENDNIGPVDDQPGLIADGDHSNIRQRHPPHQLNEDNNNNRDYVHPARPAPRNPHANKLWYLVFSALFVSVILVIVLSYSFYRYHQTSIQLERCLIHCKYDLKNLKFCERNLEKCQNVDANTNNELKDEKG